MLLRRIKVKLVSAPGCSGNSSTFKCMSTTPTLAASVGVKDAAPNATATATASASASTSTSTSTSSTDINAKEAYIKQMAAQQSESASAERPADWDQAKPYHSIPGPKSVPIFGNIWRFLPVIGNLYGMDQITQHETFHKTYGQIVKLDGLKLRNDIVICFEPNDIEKLFRNEGVWPHREGLESLIYYKLKVRDDVFQGQGGVLTGHGEEWYHARTVVNPPMMQPRSAQMYISSMNDVAQDFVERMSVLQKNDPNGDMPEDFSYELNKWALESICVIGLNKRLGLLDPNNKPPKEALKFIDDVLLVFDLLNELDVKPSLWRWANTKDWKLFVKTLNDITEFQLKHINAAIEKMENGPEKAKSEMSILEQLLLRDKKIAFSMVFDMLIAGIDTTSRTSAAALYFLSKNPRAQKSLRDECKRLLPNKDTPITKQVLDNMPYLKAVIKETTRLAPIAIGNIRRTPRDLVLNGYQIPKGTDVVASHMYLCRQDKYFPQANEFIPDRWLRQGGEEYQIKDTNPFVFLPFGFGPRSCIGRRLAQLEMEVLLAKIARNFELSWPHEDMKWIMTMLYGVGSPLKYRMKTIDN